MPDNNEVVLARGVYTALATPRRKGTIEADAGILLEYIDGMLPAGVDGLVLFGSTGEFVHFEIEERMRVSALAIRRSRIPILVNISHSTLEGALAMAQQSIDSGAAGLMLMPPYFYRYTGDQIFQFYDRFLEMLGNSFPVYIYNLPVFTNPIPPATAVKLLSTGKFAGIKDSSGDWEMFEMLNRLRPGKPFQLLAGNEEIFLRCRSQKADGIVSGLAAAAPELMVALDRAITGAAVEPANRLNGYVQEFLMWVRKFPATIAIKQAAAVRGWDLAAASFPLDETTCSNLKEFEKWFAAWWPRVLEDAQQIVNTSPIVE